jgi:acetyl esterase/lipase
MKTETVLISNDVVLERDIIFNTDDLRPLTLHLLKPKAAQTKPMPVIVYIFGGAFRMGNKDSGLEPLIPFVQRGYLSASIEYRYSSEALFPTQVQDCKCAIRFLRANASSLNLDPERIGVWGPSAGGYLSTMLGVTNGVTEFEGTGGWEGVSSGVQAVCDWFGPTDFLQMNKAGSSQDHDAADSPESELIGGPIQENKDRVRLANPITYITRERIIPPFLVIHGDADSLVPFNQSELLVEALQKVGADVTFHRVASAGHGGELFEREDISELVHSFFDKHLLEVKG